MAELLVCWDIDRTLIDAAGVDKQVWADVIAGLTGRSGTIPHGVSGRTDPQILLTMLQQAGLGDSDARLLLPDAMRRVPTLLAERTGELAQKGRALPGAHAILRRLADDERIRQTVVTGNSRDGARIKLATFGLAHFLDLEVGAYGSDPHTKRADLVTLARQRAAMDAAVVLGDSVRDIEGARSAGAAAIAVASGRTSLDQLQAANPDASFPDLADTGQVFAAVMRVMPGRHSPDGTGSH